MLAREDRPRLTRPADALRTEVAACVAVERHAERLKPTYLVGGAAAHDLYRIHVGQAGTCAQRVPRVLLPRITGRDRRVDPAGRGDAVTRERMDLAPQLDAAPRLGGCDRTCEPGQPATDDEHRRHTSDLTSFGNAVFSSWCRRVRTSGV